MKKSNGTLIFNEKHLKNLDFVSKSAKKLEFFGFLRSAQKKNVQITENHTRWGREGAPPEAKTPKGAAFWRNMWNQKISRKMMVVVLEIFFIAKNQTCVLPDRLGKFQKYGRPYNGNKDFWRFWVRQRGAPRGDPGGLGGARSDWQGSPAPRPIWTRKIKISKGRGLLFHGILKLFQCSKLPGQLGWLQAAPPEPYSAWRPQDWGCRHLIFALVL